MKQENNTIFEEIKNITDKFKKILMNIEIYK